MSNPVERLAAALSDRYRIESELGAGGMATVYLAEDLKHHRKVAVKVLRPELAAVLGAERFLKEIEVTANLQHPHILPLFDSGEADSFLYYVMPHVEGESLRDRLNRDKQLPVEEAVRIAEMVASAIFAWRPGPDSVTVPVATAPGVDEVAPALSPDGRWLAYVSNETGRQEVWVRPFPDLEAGRWQVSVRGGTEPVWVHSGRELFYKSQGSLKVVGVQTNPTFATLEVRELFSTQGYFHFAVHHSYDVTADDQRFVMVRVRVTGEVVDLIVVENFFEELKAKVGN